MISSKIKDLKYRILYSKIEKKSFLNKFLFINLLNKKNKSSKQKLLILFLFLKLKNYSKLKFKTKTKLVRRCALTNRGRGNYRPYGISRFAMREFIQFGILPGYKKAV
jgi:ribosomal protein S14